MPGDTRLSGQASSGRAPVVLHSLLICACTQFALKRQMSQVDIPTKTHSEKGFLQDIWPRAGKGRGRGGENKRKQEHELSLLGARATDSHEVPLTLAPTVQRVRRRQGTGTDPVTRPEHNPRPTTPQPASRLVLAVRTLVTSLSCSAGYISHTQGFC